MAESNVIVEPTPDPGWAYCPACNDLTDWEAGAPNCPPDGLCRGRSILPIPTTLPRPSLPVNLVSTAHVGIQWKGTDACLDLHCECGADAHYDGYFAAVLRCPGCDKLWEMPTWLTPREDQSGHRPMDPILAQSWPKRPQSRSAWPSTPALRHSDGLPAKRRETHRFDTGRLQG